LTFQSGERKNDPMNVEGVDIGILLTLTVVVVFTCPAQSSLPTLTVLQDFNDTSSVDGYQPEAPLLAGKDGVLYGTTELGGDSYNGTVFWMTPPGAAGGAWIEQVIYSFKGGSDGSEPVAGVAARASGVLYGTTFKGGTSSCGTVFSLTPPSSPGGPWVERVLHTFTCSGDGGYPSAGVAIGADGRLFGTTQLGGSGEGLVYELRPPAAAGGAWTETVLHRFTGSPDGNAPVAGVVIGPSGVLYGTTTAGGTPVNGFIGNGIVFSLAPPSTEGGEWTETVIHNFGDTAKDGSEPGGLLLTKAGVLYGTTFSGVVFALHPPATTGASWVEEILYTFRGDPDGADPTGVLALGNGVLYGATSVGGSDNSGTVFSLTPPSSPGGVWTESILWNFRGGTDGSSPEAGVLVESGLLYGTTSFGSPDAGSSGGSVFVVTP